MLIDNKAESDKLQDMITRNEGERKAINLAVDAILSAHEYDLQSTQQYLSEGLAAVQTSRRPERERAEQISHFELLSRAVMQHHFPQPSEKDSRRKLSEQAVSHLGSSILFTQGRTLLHALASEYLASGYVHPWQEICKRMQGDIGTLLNLPVTELVIRHINGGPRENEAARLFRYSPAVV